MVKSKLVTVVIGAWRVITPELGWRLEARFQTSSLMIRYCTT